MSVTITAAMVKQLRDLTDAPMMDCKNALVEAEGDMTKAQEILRQKGQATAAKKAGRSTSEGIAKFVVNGNKAAGVIVECETDFVSANDTFKKFVDTVANGLLSADAAAIESDLNSVVIDGKTIEEHTTEIIAVIRENIRVSKGAVMTTDGTWAVYNHHTGKTAALVEVAGGASTAADVGFELAVQFVALNASYVNRDEISADVIAKELEIETERAVQEGKPREMAEKIAQGRVNKEFYQSQVLMEQVFYKDNSKKVSDWVNEMAKQGGGEITVVAAHRLTVGA